MMSLAIICGTKMVIYITSPYLSRLSMLFIAESLSTQDKKEIKCEDMGPAVINQWRSLIVVTGSPYRMDTTEFAHKVRKYNQLPPFNFRNPIGILNKVCSIMVHQCQ